MASSSKVKTRRSQKVVDDPEPIMEESSELDNQILNALKNSKITDVKPGLLVLCRHTDSFFYEAKIVNVTLDEGNQPIYTVHYNGWNSRYDERLPHSLAMTRFIEHTPENVAMAALAIDDAKRRQKVLKGKRDEQRRKKLEAKRSVGGVGANTDEPQDFDIALEEVQQASQRTKHLFPRPKLRPLKLSPALEQFILIDIDASDAKKIFRVPSRITIRDIGEKFLNDLPANPEIYPGDPEERQRIEDGIDVLFHMFSDVIHDFLLLEPEVTPYYTHVNDARAELGLVPVDPYPSRAHVERVPTPVSEDDTGRSVQETLPHLRDPQANQPPPAPRKGRPRRVPKKATPPLPPVAPNVPEVDLASVYGFAHLVRFLFEFSNIMVPRASAHDPAALIMHAEFVVVAEALAKYLDAHIKDLFDPELDYEPIEA